MSDQHVEDTYEKMGAIERLLKGLPGIEGYVSKELRRDADRKVRAMLASELEEQREALVNIQERMLAGGGLKGLDRVDGAVRNLQTLIDRVKTANQGYSGLFDANRVGDDQLAALHRFDVALATRTEDLADGINQLAAAARADDALDEALERVSDAINELNSVFMRRDEALLDPSLLDDADYAPDVDAQVYSEESGEPDADAV